jgi:hypothetical protein
MPFDFSIYELKLKKKKKRNHSVHITPKVWYFKKRINPSLELLKSSMALKILETPDLWHSAKIQAE